MPIPRPAEPGEDRHRQLGRLRVYEPVPPPSPSAPRRSHAAPTTSPPTSAATPRSVGHCHHPETYRARSGRRTTSGGGRGGPGRDPDGVVERAPEERLVVRRERAEAPVGGGRPPSRGSGRDGAVRRAPRGAGAARPPDQLLVRLLAEPRLPVGVGRADVVGAGPVDRRPVRDAPGALGRPRRATARGASGRAATPARPGRPRRRRRARGGPTALRPRAAPGGGGPRRRPPGRCRTAGRRQATRRRARPRRGRPAPPRPRAAGSSSVAMASSVSIRRTSGAVASSTDCSIMRRSSLARSSWPLPAPPRSVRPPDLGDTREHGPRQADKHSEDGEQARDVHWNAGWQGATTGGAAKRLRGPQEKALIPVASSPSTSVWTSSVPS